MGIGEAFETLHAFAKENALTYEIYGGDTSDGFRIRLSGCGEGEDFYVKKWSHLEDAVRCIIDQAKHFWIAALEKYPRTLSDSYDDE